MPIEGVPNRAVISGNIGLDVRLTDGGLERDGPNKFSPNWYMDVDRDDPVGLAQENTTMAQLIQNIGNAELQDVVHVEDVLLNDVVPETQLHLLSANEENNLLRKIVDFSGEQALKNNEVMGLHSSQIGETQLCEVPITVAEDLNVVWVKSLLEVANIVWKRGLELGVSRFDGESELIGNLVEMEKRDQLAIGKVPGIKE
ncbi:hypothetical protein SESBI_29195 [Sesbania bispinosa]|nr:hypothetical protein SESBI_29195 [Sesbania bispinosa]